MRIIAALLALGISLHGAEPKKDLSFFLLEEIFPHIAVGGPWSTSIILMNVDPEQTAYTSIKFYQPNGTPWTVTDSNGQSFSERAVTLGPLQMQTIELPQTGGAIETGWALVDQPVEGVIGGQAIFRDNGSVGRPTPFEAVIPLSHWGEGQEFELVGPTGELEDFTYNYLPFDQTRGFNTCVAIANPASYQNPLRIGVFAVDEQSNALVENADGTPYGIVEDLPVFGQTSFCLRDELPQLQGRRGYLFIGHKSVRIGIVGLRFDPQGSFTTLFPMSPLL